MKRILLWGMTAALLAPGLAAHASTAPLTLGETMRLARERNLSAQASAERVLSAEALQDAAGSPLWPSIGLQVGPGLTSGRTTGAQVSQPGFAVDTTLSANQLVYDWGSAQGTVEIAANQTRIARLTHQAAQADAMAAAGVGYFQVLRAEALRAVQEKAVDQAMNHLRLAEMRLRAGTGTRAETLQFQARLANAQTSLSQARNAVAIARLTLSNQLNTPLGDRALVASPSVPMPPVQDAEIALRRAERPEVQAQALRADSDARRAAVERTSAYPGVSAIARYNQRTLDRPELYGGLALNWTLFDASRSRNRARSAERDLAADRILLEQAALAAELDIRQQLQARDEARARIASAHAGLAAAQEAYRIAVRRFELGLATQYELTDVQGLLIQAESDAIQAENDRAIAEIRLTRALNYDLASSLVP